MFKTFWVVSYPENNQWNGKVNLKKVIVSSNMRFEMPNKWIVKLLIVSKHNIIKDFVAFVLLMGGANK